MVCLGVESMDVREWKRVFRGDRDLALELFYAELTARQRNVLRKWMVKNDCWLWE